MTSTSSLDRIGCAVGEIDTPALLVDYDILSDNISRMAEYCRASNIGLRPHSKAHKTPAIAQMQIAAGARGVCCQKTGEAEVMRESGARSILISNEIVGAAKIQRLVCLAKTCELIVAVDNPQAAAWISEAFQEESLRANVVIDVNLGQDRCGVDPGQTALDLATTIVRIPGLRLRGIQAYHGRLQHLVGLEVRNEATKRAHALLEETIALFRKHGLSTEIVSGAGTGTYDFDARSGLFTEIQPGSYIFMDAHYRSIGGRMGAVYDDFKSSLTVLASVISTPKPDRIVTDSGLKAMTNDSGLPQLYDLAGWEFSFAGDEHGLLKRVDEGDSPRLGDKIRLIPSHCDTTINLYDELHAIRNGQLFAVWPVKARGRIR